MDAGYSDNLATAFVIGPGELTRLGELLKTHIGNVKLRAECADGISREFSNVTEAAQYENPRSREIVRLQLTARSDDFMKRATIDFSGSKWRGISLDFSADEDAVSKLKTGTLDILDGIRPWYGVVQSVDFVLIGFIAVFLLLLSALLSVALRRSGRAKSNASEKMSDKESAIGQLVIFGVLTAIFGVGILFNFLRDSLFPRTVFAIGQGSTRFATLERFHWGFLIAIVASVIAGILILSWQAWHNKAVNRSRQ